MKFLKYKLGILCLSLLSAVIISCDDNDDDTKVINLDARFISSLNVRTVSFVNISNDAESYVWDFGNGTTSTLTEPTVTYEENGTYTVTLSAFDVNGNFDTYQETFVIDILVCTDETDENVNPANGDINWTFLTDASFDAFGDTAGFIVDNPVIDAVNPSCRVQRFEKTTGCQTFAGLGVALSSAIDFSATTNKIFTMKVLAETQLTDVTLRLEFMPFPNTEPSQDRVASITQLGEWQELTFDFSDVPAGTFQSMIIYFERNAPCDGDIYYFDDIIQQ